MTQPQTQRSDSGRSRAAGEEVVTFLLRPNGAFPNNPELPALIYRHAFVGREHSTARHIEQTFEHNGWLNAWRDTVFAYDHFHSNAHEVLGCYSGEALLQLGGPSGPEVPFAQGDVMVIPAGVSHKRLSGSPDFAVVGAYAHGHNWDLKRGDPKDLQEAQAEIDQVRMPKTDPVCGRDGPLLEHWHVSHQ